MFLRGDGTWAKPEINRNMRCIEIGFKCGSIFTGAMINRNMRCIEMELSGFRFEHRGD